MRKYSIVMIVAVVFGLGAASPAHADDSDEAVTKARILLEGAKTPQAIQMFVHASGTLQRWDYVQATLFDDGFRLEYVYSWKSNLFDSNNRTVVAFDFNGGGVLQRCRVGRDSSFLPAFSEVQFILEIVKELVRDDRDLKKHPEIARAIENADAERVMIALLNLRKLSLLLSR